MRPILVVATFALLVPELLAAQQVAAAIPAGSTIRVTAPQVLPERTTGVFHAARSDTLWMQAGRSSQVAVPMGTVERLELSRGRARVKWALIGGATGGVIGFILGGQAGAKDDMTGVGAAVGAGAGAAQGLLIGAIGGALLAPRRWINYPLSGIR